MSPRPYVYEAKIISVADGDSFTVYIRMGFDAAMEKIKLRLFGLDTPEKKTIAGKALGIKLRAEFLNKTVIVATIKDRKDKYGRYLAQIYKPGSEISLNQQLLDEGLALPWDGKGKSPYAGLPPLEVSLD